MRFHYRAASSKPDFTCSSGSWPSLPLQPTQSISLLAFTTYIPLSRTCQIKILKYLRTSFSITSCKTPSMEIFLSSFIPILSVSVIFQRHTTPSMSSCIKLVKYKGFQPLIKTEHSFIKYFILFHKILHLVSRKLNRPDAISPAYTKLRERTPKHESVLLGIEARRYHR